MSDDLERARERRERRRATTPAGAFGGLSGAKAVRANRVLARVEAADELREITAGRKAPTPERITIALDLRELHGPEVDEALGGEEPMVDEWESGARVPSFEQVQALAKLTDFPVRFFYLPPPPPLSGGWICGADGCAPLGQEDHDDEHGDLPGVRRPPRDRKS
jgi:DNA-binding transcriptional regulator YiaG